VRAAAAPFPLVFVPRRGVDDAGQRHQLANKIKRFEPDLQRELGAILAQPEQVNSRHAWCCWISVCRGSMGYKRARRSGPGYADVPIVMLTGHGDDRVRQAALRAGANDFITNHSDLSKCRDSAQFCKGRAIKRALVWELRKEDGPPPRVNAQLSEGREAIRIHRNAESKS
jgi:hypothetical protein